MAWPEGKVPWSLLHPVSLVKPSGKLTQWCRYYSNALLDTIHKHIAIQEWQSPMLSYQQSSIRLAGEQLERALGAFDLFVLHDQPGDLDDVCP